MRILQRLVLHGSIVSISLTKFITPQKCFHGTQCTQILYLQVHYVPFHCTEHFLKSSYVLFTSYSVQSALATHIRFLPKHNLNFVCYAAKNRHLQVNNPPIRNRQRREVVSLQNLALLMKRNELKFWDQRNWSA